MFNNLDLNHERKCFLFLFPYQKVLFLNSFSLNYIEKIFFFLPNFSFVPWVTNFFNLLIW